MRVLVWHWGRRGAGPRFAAALAGGIGALPGHAALLSLAEGAEILAGPAPPRCDMPVPTYAGPAGLLRRVLAAPFAVRPLARRIAALRPDVAVCAMPALLDLLMAAALRRAGVPIVVIVHDAEAHPGDGLPLQMVLQRELLRRADVLVALSAHVAGRLAALELAGPGLRPLIRASHPPFGFGPPPPPPLAHGGPPRLLSFGRLLPYKGLDLLAEAAASLGQPRAELRVAGQGPESPELARLRALPWVRVENEWVAEAAVGGLLAWADALVLPYREASQSGVAAAALAAGRYVIATRVGGLAGQLERRAGAILCEPDAGALAGAIGAFLANPPPPPLPLDPAEAWRAEAASLIEGMRAALPALAGR